MEQLVFSLIHRPYVTGFMVFFTLFSVIEQGWLRTILWVVSSYLIALAAEWGSINHGIPFGDYQYHYDALQNDLVVWGVPFFDTISFSFLSFVSLSFATFFLLPIVGRGLNLSLKNNDQIRESWTALILGSFLMVVIDWIVDPVANLGEHWFLGKIYDYPAPGVHFGVTFANYCGWFVVALLTLSVNCWISKKLRQAGLHRPDLEPRAGSAFFAPLFWFGIVGFQLGMTWWLALSRPEGLDADRTMLQAVTGSFILAPILALTVIQIFKASPGYKKAISDSE